MMKKKSLWIRILLIVLGAGIASFGLHNIHRQSGVTEGGVLGMMLLINHWFHISPAILTPVMDILCYAAALRALGAKFLVWSAVSTACVAVFFKLWESMPYMLPPMMTQPLLAALLGAMFVGVGVGLIVRMGGSSGGDDALALSIAMWLRWPLSRAYLITDLTVLLLSLSYIPLGRIAYSLITVTLSSLIIDFIQRIGQKKS
ncbi:MAG: YitT family protein [Clostridia bacterium]|nr:YitT family protein [Clostridia bacterium]